MSIEWVSVKRRVPDDRRKVMVWGVESILGKSFAPEFLGESRFNLCCGGGQFDRERCGRFRWAKVTHWAEITPP